MNNDTETPSADSTASLAASISDKSQVSISSYGSAISNANAPEASLIPGMDPSDPLQRGVQLALQAVWLFLDSDFEKVEQLMDKKRHSLLYASEGYAAIQYMRAMMTFTKEAISSAQDAAQNTINLATHYRKPRGVGALLSGQSSRASSPISSREPTPSSKKSIAGAASASENSDGLAKSGKSHSFFRMDSPRLALRAKKSKYAPVQGNNGLSRTQGSATSMDSMASTESKHHQPPFDPDLLDAKFGDLQDSSDASRTMVHPASMPADYDDPEAVLDKKHQRSWTSGITSVADSLIGIVRAGTQAAGISKPEWHGLKLMTPTQRHAELVYAEAHLMRAMLNIAIGDGVMSLLKEGWSVRSAYVTYRNCYAYIQDAYANGDTVDDHFVSGTYLGMGVFNIVLSMLPAKLLRFIELVGFSADRRLGIELLVIAAGWRTDPHTADLMSPPPQTASASANGKANANGLNEDIHPCGAGLRSDFCSLILQVYHVFLCSDLFLGYPNLPLVEAVLKSCIEEHPKGLLYMYLEGRLLMTRTRLTDAISRYTMLVHEGKGVVQHMHLDTAKYADPSASKVSEEKLIIELSRLNVADSPASETSSTSSNGSASLNGAGVANKSTDNVSEWRQLQYLGYWERSLCLMSLGRWLEAAEGFNTLRIENNWNKAVYTYALACCMWEHYLVSCSGIAPNDTSEIDDKQKQMLQIVCDLMSTVPTLKRKVAGKSIPVEKFVIRKSRKFSEQKHFLMRPGLELLHVWNLNSKTPKERLEILVKEVDVEIERISQYQPARRAIDNPYRHTDYYDDLALLLLTKGCVVKELACPSSVYALSPGSSGNSTTAAYNTDKTEKSDPNAPLSAESQELALIAADSLSRVLRLMPFIERDHYLVALARFHLGTLYLNAHQNDKQWTDMALAQWKCILDGKPLSSPPFLSFDEYSMYRKELPAYEVQKGKKLFAAPTCAVEEGLLQATGHSSLSFYESSWPSLDWKYRPPGWADSRKYSLENMIEVRTFNATNRLKESM
ncbi:hypothetical protein BX070DRAFT_224264 [Coemansia spiralis]|nr:hypothetical protein BX070DRAFT_224264 [Coemansia spiralis]